MAQIESYCIAGDIDTPLLVFLFGVYSEYLPEKLLPRNDKINDEYLTILPEAANA